MEKVEPSVPDADVTADVVIKADSTVKTKEEGLLGRGRIASMLAKVINRSFGDKDAGNESPVTGIEGEWGSGKTSFLNLILEALIYRLFRCTRVVHFSPDFGLRVQDRYKLNLLIVYLSREEFFQ